MRWYAADGCVDDDEADEEEDDEEDEDEEDEDEEEDILELLSRKWELRQVQAGCRLRAIGQAEPARRFDSTATDCGPSRERPRRADQTPHA